MKAIRLGVNIDHIATLRNARGGVHPCPLRAAEEVARSGADLLTIHLREDRRHIRDEDVKKIIQFGELPVNLEMAATNEMVEIAVREKPHFVCLVPENRAELTTEGGLDVAKNSENIKAVILQLKKALISVAIFIEADTVQIDAAKAAGADAIEIHTGKYSHLYGDCETELARIKNAAKYAVSIGLNVHAGHGLNFENVGEIASIPEIEELNIGHFLIGEAVFTGMHPAIQHMKRLMLEAR